MMMDRNLADEESFSDLFVFQALSDQFDHLALAPGQSRYFFRLRAGALMPVPRCQVSKHLSGDKMVEPDAAGMDSCNSIQQEFGRLFL